MAASARRPLVLAALTTVVALPVAVVGTPASADVDPASTVFINELHYDNAGEDVGEAVEVAAPAGTDLVGWTIVLYNGSGGAPYATLTLAGVVDDLSGGYGVVSVATPGLQNGSPDGLALVDPSGGVEQFLSYEGSFTAVGGPADQLTSTDVGVAQPSTAPVGSSLALTGTGVMYGTFTWTAAPVSSFGAVNPGQSFGPAEPVATCPPTLVTPAGTAAAADVSATDADSAIESIALVSPPVDGIDLTVTGPGTARLDVGTGTARGVYQVVVAFGTDDDPPQIADCTIVVVTNPVLISQVQGGEAESPAVGARVVVEAVVTSLFSRQDELDGFFVQEEDGDGDDDPATSEGIFVFCRGTCPSTLAAGDVVEVTGEVEEFFGMTQIDTTAAGGGTVTMSSGADRPASTPITLPAGGSTTAPETFEAVEGMIASFDRLVVSEYFELARFGQLVLAADEVPYQFTHDNAPANDPDDPRFDQFQADLATRRIILDDDNNDQNDAVTGLADEPYPYPTGGLAVDKRFRLGDSVDGLTGVLHWSFAGATGTDAWRIRPIPGQPPTFAQQNPAPAAPPVVSGALRVATFNVLNFFTTIDTAPGGCGPAGTLDCRGADSTAELTRQQAKIIDALVELDADVVGLIEIQNDAGASTQALVDALNAVPGAGPYAAIQTGTIGGDAIKVALIYRSAVVQPVGGFQLMTSAVDPDFIDTLNRPALIQTFEQVSSGERLTVAVNHLKSKGSDCNAVGDPDLLDGQGNCNLTRTRAATTLAEFLATDPTGSGDPDFLILGDLNSYRREDPIEALEDAGYVDLIDEEIGDGAYSYLFDGQLGYLDHTLATGPLASQVAGVAEWAINADEVPLFDYNDEIRDPREAAFERESTARELYRADERRSSDHNPLVVDLALDSTLDVTGALMRLRPGGGGTLVISARVDPAAATTCPTVELLVDGVGVVSAATSPVRQTGTCFSVTSAGVVAYVLASGAVNAAVALPGTFVLADNTVDFAVRVNGRPFTAEVPGRRIGQLWIPR